MKHPVTGAFQEFSLNPILNPLFQALWNKDYEVEGNDASYDESIKGMLGGVDADRFPPHDDGEDERYLSLEAQNHPRRKAWLKLRGMLRNSGPEASWRKMFASQPVLMGIRIDTALSEDLEGGVTVGDILDGGMEGDWGVEVLGGRWGVPVEVVFLQEEDDNGEE